MKIDQAVVDAFSKKLKEWSKTLPEEERDLVRVLVNRATTVNIGDPGSYALKAKISTRSRKTLQEPEKSCPVAARRRGSESGTW